MNSPLIAALTAINLQPYLFHM